MPQITKETCQWARGLLHELQIRYPADSFGEQSCDELRKFLNAAESEVARLREALTEIQRMGETDAGGGVLVTAPMLADLAGQALRKSNLRERGRNGIR